MEHAVEMVRGYVAAGSPQFHLDESTRCDDDPPGLADETTAERASIMCRAPEEVRRDRGLPSVSCVIGTEVPRPDGAAHAFKN
jgi:tagatose-1,6-bisphosphate aldolase non-catalytic subunit AgaZ/GatZ